MINQGHLHFPDSSGSQVFMDWVRELTHAATPLPLRELQDSYVMAWRRLEPLMLPQATRLSALTAAVSCP